MTSLWWRAVLAYGLGFAVFFAIWSVIEHSAQQQYAALASRGIQATGTVTSYTPTNHDDLEYAFSVDGQPYTGGGPFHVQGSFQPGQQVQVVYERNNPTNNCACDPQAELANANSTPIGGGLWLGLAFPAWYVSQRYFRLRPSKNMAPSGSAELPASPIVMSTSIRDGQSRRTWIHAGMPQWLWTSGAVEYELAMPAQEASQRLAAAVKPDTVARSFLPVVGLLGWVDANQFQVTTRTPFVSNSFDSILEGRILAAPAGSKLVASFRIRKVVIVFMAIWIALAALFGILITVAALLHPESSPPGPPPVLFGLLFPGYGIGLIVLGRFAATWQERRLLGRVDAALGVH